MDEKKVYKIGLWPMILIILDVILIITVIIMGMIIHPKTALIAKNAAAAKEVTPIQVDETRKEDEKIAEEKVITNTNSTAEPKPKKNDTKNTTTNTANTTKEKDNSTEQYTAKTVENRPYIYDAQYTPDGLKTSSYLADDGVNYKVSDIVVPYVNMVSSDATKMNTEIETLYRKWVEEFRICSQNLNSYIKVNYTTYITSNIYSICITVQRSNEQVTSEEYFAYNFDIISGTQLDYGQVCYIAGISDAGECVQKRIATIEEYNSYYLVPSRTVSQEEVDARKAEIETYKSEIYTHYQEDILNNQLVYFLDNNLKLNIAIKMKLPDNEIMHTKVVIVES